MLNQKKLLAGTFAVVLLSGCAGGPCAELIPPPDATQKTIAQDVKESLTQARAEAAGGKTLSEDEKLLLQGQYTKGFVREGRPFVRRKGDLVVPAPSGSAFVGVPPWVYLFLLPPAYPGYGPAEVTDRYVLHLLERGYRWADQPQSMPAQAIQNLPGQMPPGQVQPVQAIVDQRN